MTKTEFSGALGCSPSTVTRLIPMGLPVRQDGTIDELTALAWILHYTSGAGGGWGAEGRGPSLHDRAERRLATMRREREPMPGASMSGADQEIEGRTSADYLAWLVCANLRKYLPEFLTEISPTLPDPDGKVFGLRVGVVALTTFLTEAWVEDFLTTSPPLPEIAWGRFGPKEAEARSLGNYLRRSWKRKPRRKQPAGRTGNRSRKQAADAGGRKGKDDENP